MHKVSYIIQVSKTLRANYLFILKQKAEYTPISYNMALHDMLQLKMFLAKFWKCWLLSRSQIPILFCIGWKKK